MRPLRTLRARLTALFLLAFGGIQLGLWLAIDLVIQRRMLWRLDDTLGEQAAEIAGQLRLMDPAAIDADPSLARAVLAARTNTDSFVQLLVGNGPNVIRSRNMLSTEFPVAAAADIAGSWRTLTGDAYSAIDPHQAGLRVATVVEDGPAGPFVVQVAQGLAPLKDLSHTMRELLACFLAVSLIVGGGTSWFLTGRMLAPIGSIARRAREITADRLSERITAPQAESELTELVQVINEMLDRLELEFKRQGAFMADVSHELKTPLAVLLGEIQSLRRRGVSDPQTVMLLETAEDEVRRMLRLVEGFLILSHIQSDQRIATPTTVSMEDVVIRALVHCETRGRKSGVRVVPVFPLSDVEANVAGDPDLLISMMENLLRNGIRYSPKGEAVEVRVEVADSQVVSVVRDCGPGIPHEDLTRVFEVFYQAKQEGWYPGDAGIGLSIVKAVAELHGGSVNAVNRTDRTGAEFWIRLPLADERQLRRPAG